MTEILATLLFGGIALSIAGAVRSGYRSGLRGDPLFGACLWAWYEVVKRAAAVLGVILLLTFVAGAFFSVVIMDRRLLGDILVATIVLGISFPVVMLPVASIFGFIGYNFGAQKRASEDLARQCLPPANDHDRA